MLGFKWVRGEKVIDEFGLSKSDLKNYRNRYWCENVHFKMGACNQYVYCLESIQIWIATPTGGKNE